MLSWRSFDEYPPLHSRCQEECKCVERWQQILVWKPDRVLRLGLPCLTNVLSLDGLPLHWHPHQLVLLQRNHHGRLVDHPEAEIQHVLHRREKVGYEVVHQHIPAVASGSKISLIPIRVVWNSRLTQVLILLASTHFVPTMMWWPGPRILLSTQMV